MEGGACRKYCPEKSGGEISLQPSPYSDGPSTDAKSPKRESEIRKKTTHKFIGHRKKYSKKGFILTPPVHNRSLTTTPRTAPPLRTRPRSASARSHPVIHTDSTAFACNVPRSYCLCMQRTDPHSYIACKPTRYLVYIHKIKNKNQNLSLTQVFSQPGRALVHRNSTGTATRR